MARLHASPLMIQGTAAQAGTSSLVAGVCRLLRRRGHRVAPFKAVNLPDRLARDACRRPAAACEVVVVDGCGSPAEVSPFDEAFADAPVLLVGDIERGGVFAALYGNWALAPRRERIRGFVINKFRGDASLLTSGLQQLEALTGVPTLGVIPFFPPGWSDDPPPQRLADGPARKRVGILALPHMENAADFAPLEREPGLQVDYVWSPEAIAGCDVVLLPGSGATVADLEALRAAGLEAPLRAAAAAGRGVAGICAGYQMLGQSIHDPEGIESASGEVAGLGLLPVRTDFGPVERADEVSGNVSGAPDAAVAGFFLQRGRVIRLAGDPVLELGQELDGCRRGNVWGVSPHGLFESAAFRRWAFGDAGAADSTLIRRLDAWADILAEHLDMDAILGWLSQE